MDDSKESRHKGKYWFHVNYLQRSIAKVAVKIGSCYPIGISILGNKVLKIHYADGCIILQMCGIPLNCTFNVTEMEKSMPCVSDHNTCF